jgi:hypothetical protein
MRKFTMTLFAAALIAPAPLLAQNTLDDENERVSTTDNERDDDFPIGLLGLAGLAGLLGLKRKERDIHVDARHDKRS